LAGGRKHFRVSFSYIFRSSGAISSSHWINCKSRRRKLTGGDAVQLYSQLFLFGSQMGILGSELLTKRHARRLTCSKKLLHIYQLLIVV
jgi:hypothetical protein